MAEPEDFYRDFLPRFIDAQHAFHDGDPEPNLALWSSEDPVTLFAARDLLESGTEPVTAAFRFVASTFSDVEIFHWETLASGVAGDFAYTAAASAIRTPGTVGPGADGAQSDARLPRGRAVARGAPPCRPQASRPIT
jgi:hypothetical protein